MVLIERQYLCQEITSPIRNILKVCKRHKCDIHKCNTCVMAAANCNINQRFRNISKHSYVFLLHNTRVGLAPRSPAGQQKVGTAGAGGTGKQTDLRGRSVYFLHIRYTFLIAVVRRSKINFASLSPVHSRYNLSTGRSSGSSPENENLVNFLAQIIIGHIWLMFVYVSNIFAYKKTSLTRYGETFSFYMTQMGPKCCRFCRRNFDLSSAKTKQFRSK